MREALPLSPMNKDDLDINEASSDDLYERFSLVVDKGQEPLRIDKFLANRIEGASRNKLQQAMELEMVQVNGQAVKPNYKIKPYDHIIIYSDMSPEQTDVAPEKMDLNIVYEDASLMVVHKPA
ncbi:MAG: S4 domain-containing protein, partial [Chitinophagaceae bacterium]